MPTALETLLTTTATALANRINALAASASVDDLIILSKGVEALKGGITLQSILEAGDSAKSDLDASKVAALAALAASLTSSQGSLTTQKGAIESDLTNFRDIAIGAINDIVNVAGPRVGDIFWGLYPDPAALPANLRACNGQTLLESGIPLLLPAWGMQPGGTLKPFVTNYNATCDPAKTIAHVTVGGQTHLRLPDFTGARYPRGAALSDNGKLVNTGLATVNECVKTAGGTSDGLRVKVIQRTYVNGTTEPYNEAVPNSLNGIFVVRVA